MTKAHILQGDFDMLILSTTSDEPIDGFVTAFRQSQTR